MILEIDANGVLSFATAPDFETTTSVTATVTVTDAAGLTDTQEVTVTVTDEMKHQLYPQLSQYLVQLKIKQLYQNQAVQALMQASTPLMSMLTIR